MTLINKWDVFEKNKMNKGKIYSMWQKQTDTKKEMKIRER